MAKEEKKEEKKAGKEKKNIRMPQVKISRMYVQVILGVIILLAIAGYVYLGYLYTDEQKKQDDLETEIAKAESEWARVKNREEKDLTQILEQTKNDLEKEESIFPVEKSANDVMEILLEAATESNVDILPMPGLKSSKPVKILGKEYYPVEFRLSPKGTLTNVLDFIEKLEQGNIGDNQYATIVVKGVSLNGSGGSWSASLSGSFYSRKAPGESI